MADTATRNRPRSGFRAFLHHEAAGGIVLIGVALLALVVANSPLGPNYFAILNTYVAGLSILHWINDGLMAVFFLLVGLEIKREMLDGQLSTWSRRALPGIAAIGGIAVPAAVYVALNYSSPETIRGWAIPAATDIAFALGVLSLLGPRVPGSLKVFLTALAILDDLGAIVVIAVFYTTQLSLEMLGLAVLALLLLIALNAVAGLPRPSRGLFARTNSRLWQFATTPPIWLFLAIGLALWFFVLQSGIHATLAGVALAFTIPLRRVPRVRDDAKSHLHILEHAIHPYVAFLIVPLFGFANAGVAFTGMSVSDLLNPVPLGIALGLFAGKQVGVLAFAWVAIRLKLAALPYRATWTQVYGVAILCGIGFTMSLFIGLLAFPHSAELQSDVKIGVLAGSFISAIAGAMILLNTRPAPKPLLIRPASP